MSIILNGLTGALAAQAALNATSQNVANAMTPGYTRQGVLLGSLQTPQGGSGVQVSSLLRFSDGYKNLQLWQATSSLGQYKAGQAYLTQLEQVMSDDTANINEGIDQFFAALNAASVQPESGPLREAVITAADGLVKRFDSLQQLLANQQTTIESQRQGVVSQVNTLTQDIALLNKQIAAGRSAGLNDAGLQDARDEKIKALSDLVSVQVVDTPDGAKSVSLKGGQPLVVGADAATLATDGPGQLKIQFASTQFTFSDVGLGGQLGGLADLQQQVLKPMATTISELALGLGNAFNTQLAAGFAPPAATPGQPLFDTSSGRLKLTGLAAADLAFSSSATVSGDSGNLTALVGLKHQTLTLTTFDPKGNASGTSAVVLGDVFTQLVGKLGVASSLNQASQTTATTVRDQAEENWKSSSGVNTDEEAISLMQYQQMYQANMKVVAVANQLFDSTLAMLG
ncbi:flagellar hook-associated protein FlgK [Roseateles sp. SL47]|jgi:flagellar hook-associated protein 1|uniref:flagellar hook-associated protein FlgK n=1 Tax=Roseateles sp. SL47 TaxID=2995138 RepID=UPI00226FEDE7|nr:flagellar hook-associated protein FlgK [Roseateles sp. SL47]WAC75560.1 flagellar hook-associated protein FlgK [Roseateles sp. SL47]